MEKLNSEEFSVEANPLIESQGIMIGLLKFDRTPPHLILVAGDKYFSLEKHECKINRSFSRLKELLEKKKTKCLFAELTTVSLVDGIHWANHSYLQFDVAQNGITCLDPILAFVQATYNINTAKDWVIFDLLFRLSEARLISRYFQLNADDQVSIRKYSRVEVQSHILELN